MLARRREWRSYITILVLTFLGLPLPAASAQALMSQSPQPKSAPALRLKGGGIQAEAMAVALVLEGVTVIDVVDGRLLPAQTVVVIGSRIQAVGPTSQSRAPKGARVVDARGKYLIPGLWDMHTHLWLPEYYYPLLIANGVTGMRDAATPIPLDTLLQWRQEITAGLRVGPPRQVVAGPVVYTHTSDGARHSTQASTPADGRRIVDSLKMAGADYIKMGNLTQSTRVAMYAEARRLGIRFGGHLALAASDSGASIIDHIEIFGEFEGGACRGDSGSVEKCMPIANRLRRNGTWVVPTLDANGGAMPLAQRVQHRFWPDSMRVTWIDSVRPAEAPRRLRLDIMARSGMPILAGSDAFPPGFSLHDELANLVWAGLTPLSALQAATLNPAKLLHATDSLGSIAPGKLADMVLLDANPLADINNTIKIQAVVANGRYFDRAKLDTLLAAVERQVRTR